MDLIPFNEFKKIELLVVQIRAAERVPSSEKLIKITVDDGSASARQIIAGIGKAYEPETLVEPRTLMGLESRGMLLAADGEAGPVLLIPEYEVSPGAEIR
jgi:methionine--tRNA ligase beta chain